MSNMATTRRTGTSNKQPSRSFIPAIAFFCSNIYPTSSNDTTANSSRRRRSLAFGEKPTTTRSSLQSDEHLGMQAASFLSQENAYETPSSVFGSQEANSARAPASARRTRLSMGSQMEFLQSQQQVETQAQLKAHSYADFNEKSQVFYFRDRKVDSSTHVPHEEILEIDILKSWLDGLKQQPGEGGVYDDLEKKAKATCGRLELLDEEQAMLADDQLLIQASNGTRLQTSDSITCDSITSDSMTQRLRKMHEEKKILVLEAASEIRRRISERSAARKVFTFMKREMDAYATGMQKERAELQSKLEEEIARRESSWVMKLDRIRAEERELRERVMNLQEENSYIHREMSTLSCKDGTAKGKIRELESQVDSYCTRAEQAEAELDALHQAYSAKESETRDLRKLVERLPVLCREETSDASVGSRKPSSLQRELSRLSSLEVALRSAMQVVHGGAAAGCGDLDDEQGAVAGRGHENSSMEEVRGEVEQLQRKTVELQDENKLLSVKIRVAVREKEDMRKALREAEEVRELREDSGLCRGCVEENHAHALSSTTAMSGADSAEGDADSQGSRQLIAFHATVDSATMSDHQLQAYAESQLLSMKRVHEDIIRSLEHNLSIVGKTVEAQKVRITRLSTRNEELVRLYHSKESEVQDLKILSSAEAEGRRVCEHELSQLREQAMKCKQELRSQDLNCKLLKEKLSSKEAELEQRNNEVIALEHQREWLEAEVGKHQRLLGEANQRAATLEHQCEDYKEKIKNLQADVEGHIKELIKLKQGHLPRVLKERDELSHEAEQMGREALRLSAEVEVLRRKVHELDEDVMVRDGQISILCNTLEDRE